MLAISLTMFVFILLLLFYISACFLDSVTLSSPRRVCAVGGRSIDFFLLALLLLLVVAYPCLEGTAFYLLGERGKEMVIQLRHALEDYIY